MKLKWSAREVNGANGRYKENRKYNRKRERIINAVVLPHD